MGQSFIYDIIMKSSFLKTCLMCLLNLFGWGMTALEGDMVCQSAICALCSELERDIIPYIH